jgi:hypothetical protein
MWEESGQFYEPDVLKPSWEDFQDFKTFFLKLAISGAFEKSPLILVISDFLLENLISR